MQVKKAIIFIIFLQLVFANSAFAKEKEKYPFYASLKVSEANIRTGPGIRYPIKWTYVKKSLPLEVIERFENWYHVMDEFGEEGWVHINLVGSGRFFVVINSEVILYRNPGDYYFPQYRLERNVRGRLLSCRHIWCRVQIGKVQGWLYKDDIWGVYRGEEF